MSIKFKLMLAIDSLVLLAIMTFGGIIYTSEVKILQRQIRSAREDVLQSLSKVTVESLLSEDDAMLIGYTADLKRMVSELEVAYVTDGNVILAHTDKKLAPRPLPLSYSGQRVHSVSDRLLVRSKFKAAGAKNISFSRKRVIVNGRAYDVAVGYSDLRVQTNIQAALDSVLIRIVKAGLLVIFAATGLALWLSSLMTRPIKKLVNAFTITGGWDLTYKLDDTARHDEIGALNREFNGMVEKLKELDQLKKDFVSSVTHELKSPIGAIESYLDLMAYDVARSVKDPGSTPAMLPRFLENIYFIKQNSSRLLHFIADLLDAARIEKGKFEIARKPAQIEPIIRDAVKLFLERARASGIELNSEFPGKLPPVLLDSERISQVLVNLVSNALKFTPKGGKVTIYASLAAGRPGTPPNGAAARKAVLRVSVEDTGIGLSKADLEKVFEKFYQVPGGRNNVVGPKGTGLGLYIVKSIVEAHGGMTFAESSGKGSRFNFELPVQ